MIFLGSAKLFKKKHASADWAEAQPRGPAHRPSRPRPGDRRRPSPARRRRPLAIPQGSTPLIYTPHPAAALTSPRPDPKPPGAAPEPPDPAAEGARRPEPERRRPEPPRRPRRLPSPPRTPPHPKTPPEPRPARRNTSPEV